MFIFNDFILQDNSNIKQIIQPWMLTFLNTKSLKFIMTNDYKCRKNTIDCSEFISH